MASSNQPSLQLLRVTLRAEQGQEKATDSGSADSLIGLQGTWPDWAGMGSGISYDPATGMLSIPAPQAGQDMAIGMQRYDRTLTAGVRYTLQVQSDNAQAGAAIFLFDRAGQVVAVAGTQAANIARQEMPVVFTAPAGVVGFYVQVQNQYRAQDAATLSAQLLDGQQPASRPQDGPELISLDGAWPTWSGATSGVFFDSSAAELFIPAPPRSSPFVRNGVRHFAAPLEAGQTYEFRADSDNALAGGQALLFLADATGNFVPFTASGTAMVRPWLSAAPGLVRRFVAPPGITSFTILVQLSGAPASDAYLRPSLRALDLTSLACRPTFGHTVLERILANSGEEPNGGAGQPSISTDGRFIAFTSTASNLIENDPDTNSLDTEDVFIYDRAERRIQRVTSGKSSYSLNPVISADGRFVAFTSLARDLIVGQTDANNLNDVFLFDRITGTTTRVSPGTGNGDSLNPAISADGEWIVYETRATEVIPGDHNQAGSQINIYLFNRITQVTQRVTAGLAYVDSVGPGISADGRFVSYSVRKQWLSTGSDYLIFVLDRVTGVTRQITVPDSTAAPQPLTRNALSADGSVLTFGVRSNSGFTPNSGNVYVSAGQSDSSSPLLPATATDPINGSGNFSPVLSPDGRYVTFASTLDDPFTAGQPAQAGALRWFLYDRTSQSGRALIPAYPASVDGFGGRNVGASLVRSSNIVMSDNARVIAFATTSPNLVANDFNYRSDLFLYVQANQCGGR